MPSSASRSGARRRRGRARTALLVTSVALAAGVQAHGPAPAAAMINQGDVGVCEPLSGLGGGLGWNSTTGQSCFLGPGSGGSGNGASDEGEIIGEPIEVEGDAPLTDCASPEEERRNCPLTEPPEDDAPPEEDGLPPQQGLGFFPGKNSTEALRSEQKQCLKLRDVGKIDEDWYGLWLTDTRERIEELEGERKALHAKWQEQGLEDWEFSEVRRLDRRISAREQMLTRAHKARIEWHRKGCAAVLRSPLPGPPKDRDPLDRPD